MEDWSKNEYLFSVVYNDLRYSSKRTNNLTSIVCEILQNKNIVIFLCHC